MLLSFVGSLIIKMVRTNGWMRVAAVCYLFVNIMYITVRAYI